jgi:hypothetical protein
MTITVTEQKYYISYLSYIAFLSPQNCEAAIENYTISVKHTKRQPVLGVRLVRAELQRSIPNNLMFLWRTQTNRMH